MAVQVIPFVYTLLYILSMVAYLAVPESILRVLDTLFYTSPFMVAAFLVESKILRLCRWHRAACILPLLPQVAVFVDYHIIPLTRNQVILTISLSITMAALLLVAAYKVFFK